MNIIEKEVRQIKVIIFGKNERIIYTNVEVMDETNTHIMLVGCNMELEVNGHKFGEFPYIRIEKRYLVINEIFIEVDNDNGKEVIPFDTDNINNRVPAQKDRRT